MTIEWAVCIFSAFMAAGIAILGWLGKALWGIRGDLREFITKNECQNKMSVHCNELDRLTAIASRNERSIERLNALVAAKHNLELPPMH